MIFLKKTTLLFSFLSVLLIFTNCTKEPIGLDVLALNDSIVIPLTHNLENGTVEVRQQFEIEINLPDSLESRRIDKLIPTDSISPIFKLTIYEYDGLGTTPIQFLPNAKEEVSFVLFEGENVEIPFGAYDFITHKPELSSFVTPAQGGFNRKIRAKFSINEPGIYIVTAQEVAEDIGSFQTGYHEDIILFIENISDANIELVDERYNSLAQSQGLFAVEIIPE